MDVIRSTRREEDSSPTKVARITPFPGRNASEDLSATIRVLAQRLSVVCYKVTWCDRIDVNPAAGPFAGEKASQARQTTFACCI